MSYGGNGEEPVVSKRRKPNEDDPQEEVENEEASELPLLVPFVNSQPSTSQDAKYGDPLPHGSFLSQKQVLVILLSSMQEPLDKVPDGRKDNVYFIINNEMNDARQEEGQNNIFIDDCGAWTEFRRYSVYYLRDLENATMSIAYKYKGKFCKRVRKDKGYVYLEVADVLNEEKYSVVEMCIYFCKNKKDRTYQRKITWTRNCGVNLALYEYRGIFPGYQAHANSKNPTCSNYMRSPVELLSQMRHLSCQVEPKESYSLLLKQSDSLQMQPKNLKQIRDQKRLFKRKLRERQHVQ